LIFPDGVAGGRNGSGTAEAPAVLHHPARAIGLIGRIGPALHVVLFFAAALGLPEPVPPRLGYRPHLLRALLVEPALGLAQPSAPALRRRKLGWQLVAARITEPSVLFVVNRGGVFEDLARDLLVITRRLRRRVSGDLGAIDRDHPDTNQTRLGAQRQHLAEQLGQRRFVALAKPRDRRVIRRLVSTDHPRGNVLNAAPLNPPRRPLTDRIAVKQQRHHHRRIMRRPTLPVRSSAATASMTNHTRCPSGNHSRRLGGNNSSCSRSHAMKFCAIPAWS
jgi:hypothetical protein